MRIRLVVVVLVLSVTPSVFAQWITDTNGATLAGKAGIGIASHPAMRLRIADTAVDAPTGTAQLAFGTTSATWWAFRLDSANDLHLDRQGSGGWTEGVVFQRDGDVGIGTGAPETPLHVAKDFDSPTILQISNGSAGASAATQLRLKQGGAISGSLTSYSAANTWWPGSLVLWNNANGPMAFGTNNVERMRIYPNGNVAINGSGPAGFNTRLLVQHGVDNSTGLLVTHQPSVETSATQIDYGMISQATENVFAGATNSGLITGSLSRSLLTGPGTLSSTVGAWVESGSSSGSSGGTLHNAYGLRVDVVALAGSTVTNGYGVMLNDVAGTYDYGIYQAGANDTNYFAGDMGIGVTTPDAKLHVVGNGHITGNLVVDGSLAAKYQDVAEWVPSRSDLLPGTVVVIDAAIGNAVMPSTVGYDTTVAGVVSAQPGLILGEAAATKEQIATTGRVRVRVDATTAAIRVGDLLVTSNRAGYAMRSMPIDVGGASLHRPGTILGKALEPLAAGEGEILVLLSLQ